MNGGEHPPLHSSNGLGEVDSPRVDGRRNEEEIAVAGGRAGTDEPLTTDDVKATHLKRNGESAAGVPATRMTCCNQETLPPAVNSLPRIEGYDILEVLGRGGMGVVYKAREIKLQRLVALKMILAGSHAGPVELLRFQTEARAVAKLQHPNIVQIYDINEQDAQWYFSLELIDGGNLAGRIDGTPQSARRSAQLTEALARAMYYAHENNIVHRDLKPGNILLTSGGNPKITDFGVAKQLDSEQGQTRSGAIVGTPSYMAPEQARGQTKTVGPAADIYSLGAILYEMLTGRPPFKGETPVDTLFQVAFEEPVPPSRHQPKIPLDLEVICLKCLEKDPNRRYLTAQALANDLARFLADEPILARPLSASERAWRCVKQHKARTAVAAAILVAFSGIAAGAFQSWDTEKRRQKDNEEVAWKKISEMHQTVKDDKAWEIVPETINELRARLVSDPDLAGTRSAMEEELNGVERRYRGRVFHRDFMGRHDEAMLKLGFDLGNEKKLKQLEDQAWKAVDLVGIRPGIAGFRIDDYELKTEERLSIERSCYELLLTLAEMKKGTESLAILDLAKPLSYKSPAYHLIRADQLQVLHDLEGAKRERNLAKEHPLSAIDHFIRANEFYNRGKILEASQEYEDALQVESGYFWARYYLASCNIRLGESARARDLLTACANQKSNIVWVYLMRGFAEGRLKDYEAAENDFELALSMKPPKDALYVLYNNRGVIRLDQKERFDEGVQDLQKAADLCPTEFNAFASLADASARQKKWNEAIARIDQAIALAKEPAFKGTLYRYRARYHSELKDDDAALADLKKEIEVESEGGVASAKTYVLRGRLLQKHRRFEEALHSFLAAEKIQPDSVDVLRARAEILFELKKYPEAIQAYDELIRNPGNTQDYKLRGLAKSHLGDHQGAAEDYSRALDLEIKAPDSDKKAANRVWLRIHRGNAFLACQADRPALSDFEELLRHDPKNAEILCGRGLTRIRLEQVDSGLQDAQQAFRLEPTTSRVCYGCGRIYAQAAAKLKGRGRKDRQAADKARNCEDRAVEFIDHALAYLPSNEQAAFWQETVSKDSCLIGIRRTLPFTKLEEKYTTKVKAIRVRTAPAALATAK